MSAEVWQDGPIILGVGWKFSEHLVRTAGQLAAALGEHLVCAFVDPASYLTEWGPECERIALSLDPSATEESEYPSRELLWKLEAILGQPGGRWSFRVLNGDVPKALNRLADNTGASMIILGADRPGPVARVDRFLEGSVSASLMRQQRPVLVVPDTDSGHWRTPN